MKNPFSRRLFFYVLTGSFFISTTIILLLVFGYRFDWTRGIFVYSGSITIKPNPEKINIKINGEEKDYSSNFLNNYYEIGGLRPGNYNVEISSPDFNSWTKNISVHSGVSTELWNVLLVRKNYERTNFKTPEIKNFFPAPKEFVFAYVSQKERNLEVGIINTEKNEISNKLVLENVQFTENEYENVEWSPDNSALIVPVIRDIEIDIIDSKNKIDKHQDLFKDYLIFNLKTNDYFYLSEKINIEETRQFLDNSKEITEDEFFKKTVNNSISNEDFKKQFSSVRWSPKENNAIYFLFNDKFYLAKLNLEEKTILENYEIYTETLAYDFADDGIYILNKSGSVLYNRDFEVDKLKELTKFQLDKNDFEEYRLNAYDNERVVLLENSTGNFYLYNKSDDKIYSKKLNSEIIDAHFSNDGKKLVYYSTSEIFVYFTRIWDDQPIREENKIEPITRFSKKISNVHFSKDYEHIIFSAGNEIEIIEIEKAEPQTITTLKTEKTKIISDYNGDILYFLDETENKNDNLFQIHFPEKSSILSNIIK